MTPCVPVFDHQNETISFIERGLWGGKQRLGDATAIGFANDCEGLVAGFAFHNYEREQGVIEMTAYSSHRGWCTKANLSTLFNYPFRQLDVRLVVARHSESNTRARRIWCSLGAKEYIIPDLWDENEAMVIATYGKSQWLNSRFARMKNGQAKGS